MAKINLYVTDPAWDALKQLGYTYRYVRGVSQDDRPRGMSAFVTMLSRQTYTDTRPEYMQETGQWMTGVDPARQRCLDLDPEVLADLGYIALEHGIYPYKSQLPVANGYRRLATPPALYPVGATPRGKTSILGLAGPVLDAIGIRHLTPTRSLPMAPADMYQTPSKRYERRARKRRDERSLM